MNDLIKEYGLDEDLFDSFVDFMCKAKPKGQHHTLTITFPGTFEPEYVLLAGGAHIVAIRDHRNNEAALSLERVVRSSRTQGIYFPQDKPAVNRLSMEVVFDSSQDFSARVYGKFTP